MNLGKVCWTAVLAGLVLASPLHAQWLVEAAAGGVAHDVAGTAPASSSSNLIFSVRREGPRWLQLSAGLPIDSAAVPWGAAGVGGREPVLRAGPAAVGLDWSGHAHAYRLDGVGTGSGFTVEALPFVHAALGNLSLEARSGLIHHSAALAGDATSRTGHDSGLSGSLRAAGRLTFAGDARLLRIDGGSYPYFGLGAEVELGGGSVWAHAGRWSSTALPDPTWGAGAEIELGHRISVRASFRQDAANPIYWNDTRRFWSIGVSRSLGAARPDPLALPAAPELTGGRVIFRVPAAAASGAPSVAGDFNGWTPVQMRRDGDTWVAAISVPPGVYQYAFRSPDGGWYVPDTFPNRVDDGFGGKNAVLIVPERSPR